VSKKVARRTVSGGAIRVIGRCVPFLLSMMVPNAASAGDVCDGIDDPHAYNYCLAAQGPSYSGGKANALSRYAQTRKNLDAPRATVPIPIAPSGAEPVLPGFLNMGGGKSRRHTLGGRFLN